MIYVIPRCEFQSSRFAALSKSAKPLDYSAGISDRRAWTHQFQKFWVEICDQGRECQDFRVTTFFANLDPTPACPPREALSSVILVGFQFRCVRQDGQKSGRSDAKRDPWQSLTICQSQSRERFLENIVQGTFEFQFADSFSEIKEDKIPS